MNFFRSCNLAVAVVLGLILSTGILDPIVFLVVSTLCAITTFFAAFGGSVTKEEIAHEPAPEKDRWEWWKMDESKAREILGDIIQPDNSLKKTQQNDHENPIFWKPNRSMVALDGVGHTSMQLRAIAGYIKNGEKFDPYQLYAMAWWLENKGEQSKSPQES